MKVLGMMIRRNTKLFFKDRGTFFTALIAPLILLMLFVGFLAGVYRDSLLSALPRGVSLGEPVTRGFVGGWLLSSLLAVCCVTVAFSANMIMVQDKVTGVRGDLTIAPVRSRTLSLSYYISTALVTEIICLVATAVGLLYLSRVGWYLTVGDICSILLDVMLLVLFGTALSSVVCALLHSQGGITAVTTIVSAAYGFLCGAYMPIHSFSAGIQRFVKCLPGTYGTVLLHEHFLRGSLEEMERQGLPGAAVEQIQIGFDSVLSVRGQRVEAGAMYAILLGAILALVLVYVLLGRRKNV